MSTTLRQGARVRGLRVPWDIRLGFLAIQARGRRRATTAGLKPWIVIMYLFAWLHICSCYCRKEAGSFGHDCSPPPPRTPAKSSQGGGGVGRGLRQPSCDLEQALHFPRPSVLVGEMSGGGSPPAREAAVGSLRRRPGRAGVPAPIGPRAPLSKVLKVRPASPGPISNLGSPHLAHPS